MSNPVANLTNKWFEIEGVKKDKRAYGFIGKLRRVYGEETLLQAFDLIKKRPTQANNIRDPNLYLRGVCRSIVLKNQAPKKTNRKKFEELLRDLV